MKLVEVQKIPVRYNGVTYKSGETFEMEEEHVLEELVNVIGDAVPKSLNEMTVPELKEFATVNGIDLGEAKKKDEILEKISEFKGDE